MKDKNLLTDHLENKTQSQSNSIANIIKSENTNGSNTVRKIRKKRYDYDTLYKKIISECPGMENMIEYIELVEPEKKNEIQELFLAKNRKIKKNKKRIIDLSLPSVLRTSYQFSKKYNTDLEETIQFAMEHLVKFVDKYKRKRAGNYKATLSLSIERILRRQSQIAMAPIEFPHIGVIRIVDEFLKIGDIDGLEKLNDYLSLEEKNEISKKYSSSPKLFEAFIPYEEIEEVPAVYNFNDKFEKEIINDFLVEQLGKIKYIEEEWIKKIYGVFGEDKTSLAQIARDYGFSPERVRQVHNRGMKRIRENIKNKKKEDYV